jgi:hypothetical protein
MSAAIYKVEVRLHIFDYNHSFFCGRSESFTPLTDIH